MSRRTLSKRTATTSGLARQIKKDRDKGYEEWRLQFATRADVDGMLVTYLERYHEEVVAPLMETLRMHTEAIWPEDPAEETT